MPIATDDPWLDDRLRLTRRPAGRAVMHQRWEDLLFLHWEVAADAIARLLPAGLEVDEFEGRAFVGLVPFAMAGVRPAGLPSVRWLSDFCETNVRTYVRTPSGDPGVWFFSLDAANPVAAFLGRAWFRLPYYHARMTLGARESAGIRSLAYESRRLRPATPPASARIRAEVAGPPAPAAPGSLEFFLAERYLLYARGRRPGQLLRGRVHHSPYPLQPARLVELEETALQAAGVDRPAAAPLAHYARRVVVEVFGLEPTPQPTARPERARGGGPGLD